MPLNRSLLVVAIATGLPTLGACNPIESGFVKACEAALQDRLKSPSTYKRINLVQTVEPLTVNEYAKGDQKIFDFYMKSERKPVRHIVLFTYDASNSFGVPIRNVAKCSYDTIDGEKPVDSKELVEIDGKTNIEWLTENIIRARR